MKLELLKAKLSQSSNSDLLASKEIINSYFKKLLSDVPDSEKESLSGEHEEVMAVVESAIDDRANSLLEN